MTIQIKPRGPHLNMFSQDGGYRSLELAMRTRESSRSLVQNFMKVESRRAGELLRADRALKRRRMERKVIGISLSFSIYNFEIIFRNVCILEDKRS